MDFDLVQMIHHADTWNLFIHHSPMELLQIFNEDILADLQKAWNNFVQTGQVWALIIGFVLGYILKALLSY